jgi:hypothetical protein
MDLKSQLQQYKNWIVTQDWYNAKEASKYVEIASPPSIDEISQLEEKFGKLPISYLTALNDFGLSTFAYDRYLTKMLSPQEIINYYEIVQNEMDFYDGLREEILEEDNLDFSKYIPVMAGEGVDGCWALLYIGEDSTGKIMYWDADQAGYLEDEFDSLEDFIGYVIKQTMKGDPVRLT